MTAVLRSGRLRSVDRRRVILDLVVPSVVALLVLGPVLRPGVLFNLDLVLPPELDTPSGFWGLGPELPRRLPMWVVVSWMSIVVPATVIGKALMFGVIVGAWAGMARLVRRWLPDMGSIAVVGAAALYALSPFILTRSLVGHFMVTVPHAVLPWVLPTLLGSGRQRQLAEVYLAAAALGAAGHFGGTLAVSVVLVGCLAGRTGRWTARVARVAVALAAQAMWLVPGVFVAWTSPVDMAGGEAFPTAAAGVDGIARLSAGGGFWNQYFQVGGTGVVAAIAGLGLIALAVWGTGGLPAEVRRSLTLLGVLGWYVSAASALGGVATVFRWVDGVLLAGLLRDGQRMLTAHLVWLAPAAAVGAERCRAWCGARPRWRGFTVSASMLPLAVAIALATPAVWGFGGRLAAEPLPASWRDVRSAVRDDPGTVLTLPWYQYFNLSVDGGTVRRVLNPLPLFLGGDVLSSSDNGFGTPGDSVQEVGDTREPMARAVVDRMAAGASVSEELAEIGVRWVVVLTTPLPDVAAELATDPSMELVVDAPDIRLYRNDRWIAAAVTDAGRAVEVDSLGPATATFSDDGRVTWFRPGTGGWRRGWRAADVDARGLVVLPAGGGPAWNLATPPSLLAQLGTVVAVGVLGRSVRRRRRARDQAVHTECST